MERRWFFEGIMSISKRKYSKAKIHITEDNKMFTTVDGRVLDDKEMKELRAYHEHEKEQKEFESKFGNQIKKRGGRPAGRRNESTIKKYNYIRNKYHIVKKKQLAHTIEEYARLIRSEMLEKKPEVFEGGFYSLSTIIDIIKKQKWGD